MIYGIYLSLERALTKHLKTILIREDWYLGEDW
jgi:hypothetical protein